MAQKIQTLLVDDLDGSEADATVRVGLDGAYYEIDLNTIHAEELRSMLARYVKAGGRSLAPPRRPARSHGKAASNWFGSNEVHDWAKANGIEVKDRGRVPADVVTRFRAATGR